MEKQILFLEKQKFTQWWLWLILLSINFIFLLGVYKQVLMGETFGSKPMGDLALLISTGCTLLLSTLIFNIKLQTQVRKDGIYIKFFPFHISYKFYPWHTIAKLYLREYSAMKEFGGYGIRQSLNGNDMLFNVSGNKGLQLELVGKKKVLIGTSTPDKLVNALNKIEQLKQ